MFTAKKLLVALVLVLFVGGNALPFPYPLPPLLPAHVYKPDLVIEKIKGYVDPLDGATVQLKVKNQGYKAVASYVRLTGIATVGTTDKDLSYTVYMDLGPGESRTYHLGVVGGSPQEMRVSAQVDTPVPPSFTGSVWESNERNNKHTATLEKDGYRYDEK